ncbi:formate dehydrogenase accessory sulfurtransferase FdhD [Alkalibaculum bacchi]|uniref:formate dehydrogenase accessory sulfurtransferase FdhD n=1 Tax=Alkalibaculum bacchi TaxID=645887 RepID=UPI0026F0C459|nr:formate dehydrogenase accessory sulfurtransferase FdhD [Alkalibaculum bacchi]
MEENIYQEFDVLKIEKEEDKFYTKEVVKKIISEISLKIIVNGEELVSLLCLNQYEVELTLGFLYNDGVINSYEDIKEIYYNERMQAVIVELKEEIKVNRQESLRSVTSGCGQCYTYINPLKKSQYFSADSKTVYPIETILSSMKNFMHKSEIFREIGGVHSVLFYTPEYQILNEDIGRHNCFDKITGILLKEGKMDLCENSIVFVSGRISSEIMTKIIRLGAPILVSRSTPTSAAVKLAQEYNITLLGYVRGDQGNIYSVPERISF